jgi:hypothetical protein
LWVEVRAFNRSSRLGLSVSNVLAPDSDSMLAEEMLLARVGRVLKSPKHSRETMLEFKEDWAALLQDARTKSSVSAAHGGAPATSEPTATMSGGGDE